MLWSYFSAHPKEIAVPACGMLGRFRRQDDQNGRHQLRPRALIITTPKIFITQVTTSNVEFATGSWRTRPASHFVYRSASTKAVTVVCIDKTNMIPFKIALVGAAKCSDPCNPNMCFKRSTSGGIELGLRANGKRGTTPLVARKTGMQARRFRAEVPRKQGKLDASGFTYRPMLFIMW
ncbi:hypothetical protein K503DRAFT_786024 [Rhizopogon vinicolor AM-OR11-026]|uniref:Uncharacterized protein n=1 Tax=Rhizopogon vinicolor AM-OR11-026 TaxID=1314800 RepID=A0A1B7MNC3_9AGAM|nr:hypothetical protein K503DRAFT_786024 [Rhizopogon vinicolor AM-OR11-026]